MEFQTNEKALLINQSDKDDFGFAYDTFLKKASVKDKCTLFN